MAFNPRRARQRVWTPRNMDEDTRLKTSWFQPSNDTMREQEEILANMYFLVRQGDEFGERLRCTGCGRRHNYITMLCVEKPITGIAGGLYAYYRAVKDNGIERDMSPEQKARFDQVHQVLNGMPDLSRTHPEMARKFVKDVGPTDMQMGAASLGILEPISPTKAYELVETINKERGCYPPYKLGRLNQAETDRAAEYRGPQFTRSRW